ncbi:hypothetical protein GJ496_002946 [Pomphorhynchus laevis]|nr:hypothetical protein GJ496_002946 [Pomphorhynchus laevis]
MGSTKSKKHGSHVLTDEVIEDVKRNTNFTDKQIQKYYNGFIKDCPDGYLTRRKLEETYKVISPKGNPTEFCKAVFNAFDANSDGLINFHEYMLAMALIVSDKFEDSLKIAFKIYDIDKNGFLSLKELEQSLRAIYNLKQDTCRIEFNKANIKEVSARIMQHCDTSKDNQISLEEFVAACKDDCVITAMHTVQF